jgi:hypothetical protein
LLKKEIFYLACYTICREDWLISDKTSLIFWPNCPFTEFYQAYRLLLFALHYNGEFLLIHDERNPAFLNITAGIERGRFIRFKRLLPEIIGSHLHILGIQAIVCYLEEHHEYSWLSQFKARYL